MSEEINSLFEELRTQSIQKHHRLLAQDARKKNDFVAADYHYKEAIKENPQDVSLQNEYAVNLLYIGDTEKAKSIFETFLELEICCPSNYMMACDYLGIPIKDRKPIQHLYNSIPESQAKHNWRDHDKMRICYITADCHFHPSGRAFAKICKNQNREKYHTTVLYAGDSIDIITKEIIENVDRFISIGSYPNENAISSPDLFKMIQDWEIDVLVDLDGHTNAGFRLGLFAKRPAHKNITMLGYPNSTALDFFDLRIGSDACHQYDTELVHCNPCGLIPVFDTIKIESRVIKNEGLIFGVIAGPAKITKKDVLEFDNLLINTPNSKLVYARLHRHFTEQKSNEILSWHSKEVRNRISIVNMRSKSYLEMFNTFDIILDTHNWNMHATMIDALSCGVPVLNWNAIFKFHDQPSNHLYNDVYNVIGFNDSCITDALIDYNSNNSKTLLNHISDMLFEKMKHFDNTHQWTLEYESAIDSLFE